MSRFKTFYKKNKKYLSGFVIIAFCFSWIIRGWYLNYKFKSKYEITNAKVTRISNPGWKQGGDYSVIYEYYVDGKNYWTSNIKYQCENLDRTDIMNLLLDKWFPVVFSKDYPSSSILILTRKDANLFYGYQLPDSLRSLDSILTCGKQ